MRKLVAEGFKEFKARKYVLLGIAFALSVPIFAAGAPILLPSPEEPSLPVTSARQPEAAGAPAKSATQTPSDLASGRAPKESEDAFWRKVAQRAGSWSFFFMGCLFCAGAIAFGLSVVVNADAGRVLTEAFQVIFGSPAPWGLGAMLGAALLGVYSLLPSSGWHDYWERYADGAGLYFSGLGLSLALHAILSRSAPILDWRSLLKSLREDFGHVEGINRFIFVFPALNLDYMGAHWTHYGSPRSLGRKLEWEKYKTEVLRPAASDEHVKARVLLYDTIYCNALYDSYAATVIKCRQCVRDRRGSEACPHGSDTARSEIAKKCAESAEALKKLFAHSEANSKVEAVAPWEFPAQTIVVNDIVYLIISWGMPTVDEASRTAGQTPKFTKVDEARLRLIAYRREDAHLAATIEEEVERYFEVEQRIPEAKGA